LTISHSISSDVNCAARPETERASDERGRLGISGATNRLNIGNNLRSPGHSDPTVNHDHRHVCVRQGRVEQLWPITARGAVY
jgi:3-hydroxy-D-aspartate aldolase